MIRIIKRIENKYVVRAIGDTLFEGKWSETKAHCYWFYGIPRLLLDNIKNTFDTTDINVALFDNKGILTHLYKETGETKNE